MTVFTPLPKAPASTSPARSAPSLTAPSPKARKSSPASGSGRLSLSKRPSSGSSDAPTPPTAKATSRSARSSRSKSLHLPSATKKFSRKKTSALAWQPTQLRNDYPTRIVILSERSESKDLSSNLQYLGHLEISLKLRSMGRFPPF